jgi:hypothetical protein
MEEAKIRETCGRFRVLGPYQVNGQSASSLVYRIICSAPWDLPLTFAESDE